MVNRCDNCGAPLSAAGAPCGYCSAGLPAPMSFGSLGHLAATNARALERSLPRLAEELRTLLPGCVSVERGGLLGARQAVRRLEVDLDAEHYSLRLDHGRAHAQIGAQHRGVVLRHDDVTVTEWLRRLSDAVRTQCGSDAELAPALARLFTDG